MHHSVHRSLASPLIKAVLMMVAVVATIFSAYKSQAEEHSCVSDPKGDCENQTRSAASFAPMVAGNNSCYMIQAYFPRSALASILPEHLSIPDDGTMARHYPETVLDATAHPFMLSVCHGASIHDVFTNINVPEQEEIMFVFPVIYTRDNGAVHLASYVPVLYLDSFIGMVGGLYFGLRKEYHPGMEHGEDTPTTRWWTVEGILDTSFEIEADEELDNLPHFFGQTFANPFVTVSYPLPFSKTVFYQARVYPEKTRGVSATFHWRYRGETVQNNDKSSAVYSEYSFTMSQPMHSNDYFEGY